MRSDTVIGSEDHAPDTWLQKPHGSEIIYFVSGGFCMYNLMCFRSSAAEKNF
jgi:hypothetical protein